MKVYKDNQHSVTLHPFAWQGRRYLMVCVGLYARLDPEGGQSSLGTEQDFWKEAPAAFAALGQPPLLDMCMPKPAGEALVAGCCRAPEDSLVAAQEAAFRVGNLTRRIAVFGDRERLPGGGVSEPVPFRAMPLVWERAFGGPDFPLNPVGRGLEKDNRPANILPNLEDPDHLLLLPDDRPQPVCPFAIGVDNPARRYLSGTYDQNWLDNRWPNLPDDCLPEFFHSAQKPQRLNPQAAESAFFQGNESIEIIGMHHQYPHIRSRLPEIRLRAFVLTAEEFVPFAPAAVRQNEGTRPRLPYAKDLDGPGLFKEVDLHCDTVWLLPDIPGAFVLWRGMIPVVDDEMDDVLRVLVVSEKPADTPQTLEYYREELKKRAYPAVEIDITPFEAAQAKITKAVKAARDVPKILDRVKKNVLGKSPVMPLSLGDMAHSTRKTIACGRATLDKVEKEMLAQREQFSHLVSFDLSIFPRMRATLDEQEKNLLKVLDNAQAEMDRMGHQLKTNIAAMRKNALKAVEPPSDASPQELLQRMRMARQTDEEIDKLDTLTPEGILCKPMPINPWHDRGFPLVIAARRSLQRNDSLLSKMTELGFDAATIENAWLGCSEEELQEKPEDWGLPAAPRYTLPAGLYVPRFTGKTLSALRIYYLANGGDITDKNGLPLPINPDELETLRGVGADSINIFLAPGSDEAPLSLPPSYPGGAVVVAPEDLSALFTEQEAGDFCHIVAASSPAELKKAENLPPLTPDIAAEEGGLPLLVILPPLPDGKSLEEVWRQACPDVRFLHLPEGCPHVLALAGQGHRLRRLILDALPPELAAVHDFDFPLPPKDKAPEPFKLNLPLPGKEELQARIDGLIKEIRSHFPDPQQMLAEAMQQNKELALANLAKMNIAPEIMGRIVAALEQPIPDTPPHPPSLGDTFDKMRSELNAVDGRLPEHTPPEIRAQIKNSLKQAEKELNQLENQLTPLEKLRDDGMAKIEAFKKGELPEEVKAAFAEKGMDPDALRLLSREEVESILAADKNLERRNLQGLDLSGLDFSNAKLAHALCGKTSFCGCRMDGADFTFTLAGEADFSGASLREARFEQTVLQKAVLRQCDFRGAKLKLTTLGECDCSGSVFDASHMELCNFTDALLSEASFAEAELYLCAFNQAQAPGAVFDRVSAFKCLFRKTDLKTAAFPAASLKECLFQGCEASGVSLAGSDLRKFHVDDNTDLSGADFSGCNLREASFRMGHLQGADFYNANLENALLLQCDFSHARLDGVQASGCSFTKCDL
ncbi:MAG: DUF2169 domain-containing protein, partial [Desulfovibrionaceae bacterium]|nr:DUF2169 domain-containing protein [Desulfovibrionaceae bacterium]